MERPRPPTPTEFTNHQPAPLVQTPVMRDLLYATRGLLATPLVSLVAVLSLALGIGANTAIFSLLDGLVLRPLPVRDPDRLALLLSSETDVATSWTYPIWEQLRDRRDIAAGAAAW